MIYTFTIENDFFDDFRDKLNVKDARTVLISYQAISSIEKIF